MGAMANSISSASLVSGLSSVKAKKYVGGFAGRATVGFGTTLGGEDEKKPTLVDSVSKLLGQILTNGTEEQKNQTSHISRCDAIKNTRMYSSGKDSYS